MFVFAFAGPSTPTDRPTSRLSLPLLHPPFALALSRFVTRFRAYHLSAASQTKDQACAYAATKDQVYSRIFRPVFPFVLRFEIYNSSESQKFIPGLECNLRATASREFKVVNFNGRYFVKIEVT